MWRIEIVMVKFMCYMESGEGFGWLMVCVICMCDLNGVSLC